MSRIEHECLTNVYREFYFNIIDYDKIEFAEKMNTRHSSSKEIKLEWFMFGTSFRVNY